MVEMAGAIWETVPPPPRAVEVCHATPPLPRSYSSPLRTHAPLEGVPASGGHDLLKQKRGVW